MPEMLEYFPEPKEHKPIAECVECGKPLYKDEKAVFDAEDYICLECAIETAFFDATKKELIQFVKESDMAEKFRDWYYEQFKATLGAEL